MRGSTAVLLAALCGCGWLTHIPDAPRECDFTDDAVACQAAWEVTDRMLHGVYGLVALLQDARAAGNNKLLSEVVREAVAILPIAREAFEIVGRDTAPLDEAERVVLAAMAWLSV